MEPLNTGDVKHYLQFGDEDPKEIAEPIKFDAANFVLKQKEGGMGRDVSLASGAVNLRFDPNINFRGLTHFFDRLLQKYETEGYEMDVKYLLEIYGDFYVIGQLDAKEADTDQFTYFDCKVIQENEQETVYRRSKIKVDLFSDEDKDGEPITALTSEKMFLRATPVSQKSEWILPFSWYGLDLTGEAITNTINFAFNPFPAIQKSGVEVTLSPAQQIYGQSGYDDFTIIRAENTITQGVLVIEELSYLLDFNPLNNFPTANGGFYYYIGSDYQFGDGIPIFETGTLNENNPSFSITNQTFTIDDLTIKRGEYLLLFFYVSGNPQNQSYSFNNRVTNGKVKFSGVSTSISSIIRVVKYGEALKQVVKSISGLEIDAPRFLGENAQFAEQYITDGLRVRNIIDEPFNLSLDDLAGQLEEWRGDYEVTPDKKVFFGLFEDFYKDVKIGEFIQAPDETFKSTINELYATNTFELKYSSYENGNDENGSREGVHTELQMLLPNKGVENVKAVNIPFVRDSFKIENTRKRAIIIEEETATDSDDEIFIIDGVTKTIQATEDLVLKHLVVDETLLKLLNNGTFNWSFTGMQVNDFITLEGENGGTWRVGTIEAAVLTLIAVGLSEATFSGETLTGINYTVTATNLTNRTSEGFALITGTSNPDGFSNLRFTPKRNILNYWANYLITACQFRRTGTIRMAEYVHNRDLETFINGNPIFVVIEGQDIPVELLTQFYPDAILTAFEITTKVICDFTTFWVLKTAARTERGYISITNNKGFNINVYPKELDYDWELNLLTIMGEKKRDTLTLTVR